MEADDTSPHQMMDARREHSAERVNGNVCDGVNFVNTPHSKKILRNFRSIRRRSKSRINRPSVEILSDDESHSLPHYLKATSSSKGKKSSNGSFSDSCTEKNITCQSSPSRNGSSSLALSRLTKSGNNKTVRIFLRKTSFKPKRPLTSFARVSNDVSSFDRATHSSTIKDSKFPNALELHPQSELDPAVKVCRYRHCSLHGHCHGNSDSIPPMKQRLKVWSLKKQRSMISKRDSGRRPAHSISPQKEKIQINKMIHIEGPLVVRVRGMDFSHAEISSKPKDLAPGNYYLQQSCLAEIAIGETAFHERSYQETVSILREYSSPVLLDSGAMANSGLIRGYCLKCSCEIQQQNAATPDLPLDQETVPIVVVNYNHHEVPQNEDSRPRNTHVLPIFEKPREQVSSGVDDNNTVETYDDENKGLESDLPETPVIFDVITKNNSVFPQFEASSGSNSDGDEGELTTDESKNIGNSITSHVDNQTVRSPVKNGGGKLQFSRQRHVSMWHLIHQRMSSDSATPKNVYYEGKNRTKENPRVLDMGTLENNDDSEDVEELETRKLSAIKLVREAIEKILLPEVQDQTYYDEQSITPLPEHIEKNVTSVQDDDKEDTKAGSNEKEQNVKADDVISDKDEKKIMTGKMGLSLSQKKAAPKHWSNLKKWVLLQRFIKELEKVRKLNFTKPDQLPLNPDPEAEKVELRAQMVDERKKSEEWMLDYALRQAVNQLAPTQKRKVALLVKAFETVAPTSADNQELQAQVKSMKSPRPKDLPLDLALIVKSGKQQSGTKVTVNALSLNDVCGETPQKFSERGEMNLVVSSAEETEAHNFIVSDGQNHIKMWHMVYQHVVSGIAEKIGNKFLDVSDDDDQVEVNNEFGTVNHDRSEFTKTDALKLIKEAVDEILLPEIPEENNNSSPLKHVFEPQKSKNWSKLKKLILLKRSIGALQMARKVTQGGGSDMPDSETEKIELRRQMMDERNKAEQWMLDYAVQHIVGKLTPARKRRVSMLVEAFEAVVPFPQI